GMSAMLNLASQADILIENFRPGVADRIGLGYETLHAKNANLVFGSSSGYGDEGPMKNLAALEPHLQAFSGMSGVTGHRDGDGQLIRFTHLDPTGAVFFCGLLMLGLIERERFGHACWVKTSHLANAIANMNNKVSEVLLANGQVEPLGSGSSTSAPNHCYLCQDNRYIAVSCENQKQWESFCSATGLEELLEDDRFIKNIDRIAHRDELDEILKNHFQEKPSRWWSLSLTKAGVPNSFDLAFDDLIYHQQIIENDFLVEVDAEHTGPFYVGGLPWNLSVTPAEIDKKIPLPGGSTEEVISKGFESNQKPIAEQKSDQPEYPLQGIKVLDVTQGYAGPYLTFMLAEAGAEVVKIEPTGGDWSKELSPQTKKGVSALYQSFNRNKEIIELDLSTDEGIKEFENQLSNTDILIEEWAPDSDESKRYDYSILKESNPSLIHLSLSAFGHRGPMRNQPGSDLTIQAMCGYLRTLGDVGEEPIRVGADVVSTCTAAMSLIALLSALYHQIQTGKGQKINSSMLGTMMAIKTLQWSGFTDPDSWEGNFCKNETDGSNYGQRTKDGSIFATPSPALVEEKFYEMITEFGMLDEFKQDDELVQNWWNSFGVGTKASYARPLWDKYLTEMTSEEVLDIFNRYEVWAVEFSEIEKLKDHPQIEYLGMFEKHDDGTYLRAPWKTPWGFPNLNPVK
ncbi:MAG: CoA transferase, partial [Gammaproteobacteria bacterium]